MIVEFWDWEGCFLRPRTCASSSLCVFCEQYCVGTKARRAYQLPLAFAPCTVEGHHGRRFDESGTVMGPISFHLLLDFFVPISLSVKPFVVA
jgi:hypothetical protein